IAATRPRLVGVGLGLLLMLKLVEGVIANWAFFRRFAQGQGHRSLATGINWFWGAGAAVFLAAVYGLTSFRFAGSAMPKWLEAFPADSAWRLGVSGAIDGGLDQLTKFGQGVFDGIIHSVSFILDSMEAVLV